jgi:phosphoribosyl 1,2-cyclic phosphodiesterase
MTIPPDKAPYVSPATAEKQQSEAIMYYASASNEDNSEKGSQYNVEIGDDDPPEFDSREPKKEDVQEAAHQDGFGTPEPEQLRLRRILIGIAVCVISITSIVLLAVSLRKVENTEYGIEYGGSGTATTTSSCEASNTSNNNNNHHQHNKKSKLVFLGTGSSTGCPKPICIMESPISKSEQCKISRLALSNNNNNTNPKDNKNYRNNPSLLIHTHTGKNIIIDVGKTFREGALRWLPHLNLNTTLDAVILTHHHMDAAAGLDDLRGFQGRTAAAAAADDRSRIPIPVYLSKFCHEQLQSQFPWLLPKTTTQTAKTQNNSTPSSSSSSAEAAADPNNHQIVVKRDVASLQATRFEDYQPFEIHGVTITPLPIWHGDDLISHGFAISIPNSSSGGGGTGGTGGGNSSNNNALNIVYLSDISRMVPETLEYIQQQLPPTDIFICDALLWHEPHSVHFSLEQAVALARQIRPRQGTYLVGMNCDKFLPHDEMNAWLKATYYYNGGSGQDDDDVDDDVDDDGKGLMVQFAHDGLVAAEV